MLFRSAEWAERGRTRTTTPKGTAGGLVLSSVLIKIRPMVSAVSQDKNSARNATHALAPRTDSTPSAP